MALEIPETLDGMTAEALKTLRDEALAEAREINAKETLTKDETARLNALLDVIDNVDSAAAVIEAEEVAAAAARDRLASLNEPGDGDDDEDGDEEDGDKEEPADEVEVEVEVEREPVLAAGRRKSTVRRAAARAPKPEIPEAPKNGGLTIIAAANVPDMQTGQELDDMTQVAQAFLARARSFGGQNPKSLKAGAYKMTDAAQRFGVARLQMPETEFTIDPSRDSAEKQFETIMAAAKESRLPGGSLVAAAGWCAPSEQIWGFCELETTAGLLSIPEIVANRGGITFSKGPQFGDLFADPDFGFILTEAEVIAAEEPKPCYAVQCDDWDEVRLDAVGFCITAGLLTNAAYPELVRRVLNLAGVGQARRINASTISRISAAIGTAINWVEVGVAGGTSGTADTLEALEFQALRLRQQFAMDPNATIEGIAPFWFKAILRADLSRRLGLTDPMGVTDAMIQNWLGIRGVALQFVYDYQPLTATNTDTWTSYPTSVEVMLYPAGAYVRLTNNVINLDAVHDHDSLTQNTYTAAFFEQGMAVANTCGEGVKVQISFARVGAAGFPQIGAGEGVTFAAPAAP